MQAPPFLQLSSTKTYTHAHGLSCCFRQWNADSHCHFLHGYALQISLEFSCHNPLTDLDKNGWVVDFGALKPVKSWLEETFDHKLLIAEDDPRRLELEHLNALRIAEVNVYPKVGMESFGVMIYAYVDVWLKEYRGDRKLWLSRVSVNEHETNGITIRRENPFK